MPRVGNAKSPLGGKTWQRITKETPRGDWRVSKTMKGRLNTDYLRMRLSVQEGEVRTPRARSVGGERITAWYTTTLGEKELASRIRGLNDLSKGEVYGSELVRGFEKRILLVIEERDSALAQPGRFGSEG